MARERAKFNIPMVIACVLLCLTMFSLHFTSDIFARYTTRADGKDNAKVASFGNLNLEETGDFSEEKRTAVLLPGVDLEKKVTVSFGKSELATIVFVEVIVSDNWVVSENRLSFSAVGGDISWEIAEGWKSLNEEIVIGGKYVYYREVKAGEELPKTDIIKDGIINVSENLLRGEMPNNIFEIDIRAVAAQYDGSSTIKDIWANAK